MLPTPTTTILSSDPVATLAAAVRRAMVQPTVAELVTLAIVGTDFFGEITLSCDTMALAAEYADYAAERWEDARDELAGVVLPTLVEAVRLVLLALANDVIATEQQDALDARVDAIEAGDLDEDGEAIPYRQYRSL